MDKLSTGISELDNILHGGFPEGATIMVVGRPGSGKTVLAHQVMFHNAAPDFKAIYFTTLSEPQVKVMRFQQEFSYYDQDKFQVSVFYRDLGSSLRKRGLAHTLAIIDKMLQEHQPRLVIIDSIKTMTEIVPTLTEFREFLLDLSLRLATWGCTSLLLGEYCEEEIDLRPESAIADGIIYLSGTEERRLQKRFLRILKMRGTGYVGGENVFRISTDGIEVFPRIDSSVTEPLGHWAGECFSIGIPELDEMMGGGIPWNTTTLLSGASGAGKTLLALQFAIAGLQSGETVAYVCFEESLQQLIASARCLGVDLNPHLASGKFNVVCYSPMELDLDINIYEMQQLVKRVGATRLLIDSISSVEKGINDKTRYFEYVWTVSSYFKTRGINVLLTYESHNPVSLAELTRHGISFVADNLLHLRILEEGPESKRYMKVVKMRGCSHTTTLRELLVSEHGLTMGEPPGI